MELIITDEERQRNIEKFERLKEKMNKEIQEEKKLTELIGENLAVKCGDIYCYIPLSGILATIGDIKHGNQRLTNIKAYDINKKFMSIPLTDEIIECMRKVYPELFI